MAKGGSIKGNSFQSAHIYQAETQGKDLADDIYLLEITTRPSQKCFVRRSQKTEPLSDAPSCWQAISAKVGADRAVPVLIIGILVFLPGFYHLRITYYASKGYQGYSYDDIPDFDD
uniref:Transmembrane protein 230 n=1 Tax=Bos mutus grunniens TaxID=30521 RepID=A0A8B9W4P5_BOSMU